MHLPELRRLLGDLDASVSSTDLQESSRPGWWSVANGVQTLLATVAILGFAWLAVLFARATTQAAVWAGGSGRWCGQQAADLAHYLARRGEQPDEPGDGAGK